MKDNIIACVTRVTSLSSLSFEAWGQVCMKTPLASKLSEEFEVTETQTLADDNFYLTWTVLIFLTHLLDLRARGDKNALPF